MAGISPFPERVPYLRTWNDKDPRCKVKIKHIWSQTEIDNRHRKNRVQKQMIGQIRSVNE